MAPWTEPQLTIIADDLTGASDTATCFAQAGLTTLVSLELGRFSRADVLAVTTHSRHLSEDEAANLSRLAAKQVRRGWRVHRPGWVYAKIDSTLRGHPGASLSSVMASLGAKRALVAPAFPAQGRTTIGGQQLVDGQLLACTPFGPEVGTSSVAAVLQRSIPGQQVRLIDLDTVRAGVDAIGLVLAARGPRVFVADATTEDDLALLARAAVRQDIRMLCGSAGLAQALSDALPLVSAAPAPDLPEAYGGAVLAVAGSRHSSTVRQVEAARQDGILTLCPEEGLLGASYEMTTCRVAKTVAHQLSRGNDLVLTTAGLKVSGQGIQDVAERLGKITRGALVSVRTGGLILTGGDVAMAVCSALRCSALWLCGEVEPGIPWGRLLNGARPGLPVVTKAGGFGDQQALVRAIRYLHEVNDSTSLEELAGK